MGACSSRASSALTALGLTGREGVLVQKGRSESEVKKFRDDVGNNGCFSLVGYRIYAEKNSNRHLKNYLVPRW